MGGNATAELTLNALASLSTDRLVHYSSSLCEATSAANPPYGLAWYGERYRDVARDPDWFVGSLVDNAFVEGEGARKLWALSAQCSIEHISQQVKRHAIDESRHAQYYIRIIDIIFPNSIPASLRPELDALSPKYLPSSEVPTDLPKKSEGRVLDELVQMNIGEIRTRINQLLLRPVAHAYCGTQDDHSKLQRVLDRLMRDETRHIHYTANILEDFSRKGKAPLISELMIQRMDDFNRITLQEVGQGLFDGS